MATDIAAIETRSLTKVYPGFWNAQAVTALSGLNLTVNKGEIFGLLGPNGSGKTTTIKLLLNLINPTSGTAAVLGKPAGDQIARRSIGYLPEETYLYRFLNARQTLDFYGRLFNMNRAQRARAVDFYLDFVGLDPAVRRRRLGTYSKGQARRVGLAQALLNDPSLVILDEPTSGLDPIGAGAFDELIRDLSDSLGLTVFMITHDLDSLYAICDRVAVIADKAVVAIGTIDMLKQSPHPWIQEYFNGPRGRVAASFKGDHAADQNPQGAV